MTLAIWFIELNRGGEKEEEDGVDYFLLGLSLSQQNSTAEELEAEPVSNRVPD